MMTNYIQSECLIVQNKMGNATNQNPSSSGRYENRSDIDHENIPQTKASKPNSQTKQQPVQMQQLNKNLLSDFACFQNSPEYQMMGFHQYQSQINPSYEQRSDGNQPNRKNNTSSNNRKQQNKEVKQFPETYQGFRQNQENFIDYKNCTYCKRNQQQVQYQQRQKNPTSTNSSAAIISIANQNEPHLGLQNEQNYRQSIVSLSSDYSSFRSSFISDQSQTSIYLQPPQFMLQSPTLMHVLNRTLTQFFQFSEFLGHLAIHLFKFGIYFVFIMLAINALVVVTDCADCLSADNGGIMQLNKWFLIDLVVTSFILLLLWMHKYLIDHYKLHGNRQKRLRKHLQLIQHSWIALYAIKYLVLNSIGSAQFFTYTYKNAQENQLLKSTDENGFSQDLPSVGGVQCPHALNFYIIGIMVYNYISVVFLCVFVVENIL